MPERRESIRCDCDGGLVKLSETQRCTDSADYGTPLMSTEFYECERCEALFKRDRVFDYLSNKIYLYELKPYKGRLTGDDITMFLSAVYGFFLDGKDDEKVLKFKDEFPLPGLPRIISAGPINEDNRHLYDEENSLGGS